MACIFCGTQDNLTDEHIFHAFIGGELRVPNGSWEPAIVSTVWPKPH
jgi:hypothetical protein